MKIPKLTNKNVSNYFSAWAIQAGEEIEKKSEKEKWGWFDYSSAVNFMLLDIEKDVKKLINNQTKQSLTIKNINKLSKKYIDKIIIICKNSDNEYFYISKNEIKNIIKNAMIIASNKIN